MSQPLNAGNAITNPTDKSGEEKGRTAREANNRKDTGGSGHDVKHSTSVNPGGGPPEGPMGGVTMNFTTMLENLSAVADGINYAAADPLNDLMDEPSMGEDDDVGQGLPAPADEGPTPPSGGDDELLNELNQIFTPILIMQGFEGDIADRIQEACSEDNVLMERNMIRFDDRTRMAQLIAVCALLISRQKNTQEYQMFKKASEIRKSMKVQIQKQEYSAAQALAQKYLVKVSTSNNSSVARQAAEKLLPETN